MADLNLNFLSFEISNDEDVSYWSCNVNVSDYADFELVNKGDTFKIQIIDEIWSFIVVSKSINRSSPEVIDFSIVGRSDTCLLETPFRAPLIYNLQKDTSAKEVVTALLDFRPISWLLKDSSNNELDWILDKFSIAENGSTRLDVAKNIIHAAGGVLECDASGLVIVRPLFYISPLKYNTIVPEHSFTDVENLISLSYNYTLESYYDYVRVRNTNTSDPNAPNDKIEMVFDNNSSTKGLIKIYPYPYRDVNCVTTADETVIVLDQLSKTEEISTIMSELVDFVKGAGSTQYPINTIVDVTWQAVDLGSVSFNQFASDVYSTDPLQGYSLALITYTTKCYTWKVIANLPASVTNYDAQFLVVDPNV